MATISSRLKEERERLGLNQTDFARLGGYGKHSQIRYEAGGRSPDGNQLAALAAAGVDTLFVLTGRRESDLAAELNPTGVGAAHAELEQARAVELQELSRIRQAEAALGAEAVALTRLPAVFSSTDTLPHHGLAKCGIDGWGKDQPDRPPLPKPEFIQDPGAFWVSATGQSMKPEGIQGSDYCLVSPAMDISEGDRIWIRDKAGKTSIKRVVKMTGETLHLRGWMDVQNGEQTSFDEERFSNYIDAAHPVVAVFRGRPGGGEVRFVPDPREPDQPLVSPVDGEEMALVHLHEVQAAAGDGRLNWEGGAISSLAFPKRWLRQLGVSPASASLIYVSGDSMRPVLQPGAMILVNHNRVEIRGRRVYAFRHGEELRVKRLEMLDAGQLLVTSDNPSVGTELVSGPDLNQIEIVGEVVWTGYSV